MSDSDSTVAGGGGAARAAAKTGLRLNWERKRTVAATAAMKVVLREEIGSFCWGLGFGESGLENEALMGDENDVVLSEGNRVNGEEDGVAGKESEEMGFETKGRR